MKKLFYIFSILLLALSCANSKNKSMKKNAQVITKAIVVDDMGEFRDNTPTDILGVSVTDSILTLKIAYNGGCKEHDFNLYGSRNIQKSLPPIRGIMLFHNNNGDDCREKIEEEIKFNIVDFKYPNGDIMLAINGFDSRIRFTDPSIAKQ
jgi:hypothetical protein